MAVQTSLSQKQDVIYITKSVRFKRVSRFKQ